MQDPRGNVTAYAYDKLGRRTSATNPLSQAWLTAFADIGQATQTIQTYPNGYSVQRAFDALGRLASLQYGSPTTTPDVQFTYDLLGSRAQMREFGGANFTNKIRETTYGYDAAQRLTSVGFNTDGDLDIDETVAYEYDTGGLRTKLTVEDAAENTWSVVYTYDTKGRLITATDWDSQRHTFSYDGVDRHTSTLRPNRLISQYRYDNGGRLRQLRHHQHGKLLGQFDYIVDARGNRTQVKELVRQPGSGTTTTTHTPNFITTDRWGQVDLEIVGYEATITYGTAANGSYFDVYVNDTLWESFDGYAASAGEKSVVLRLTEEGRHRLSFRNRHDHALASSGYRMEIKTIVATANAYSANTVNYTYDQLARLIQAVYVGGSTYTYGYDLAGNLTNYNGTARTFDAANRLAGGGFTYDANGNLTSDGTHTYTWDRANRMLSMGDTAYQYDGVGNRITQTVNSIVTKYLLDTQPGLVVALAQTTNGNTTRFMHSPMGIHAYENAAGNWSFPLQDGLGSVLNEVDLAGNVLAARRLDVYGNVISVEGTFTAPYEYTGEMKDANGLLHLRARNYSPNLGVFANLDFLETPNRYVYVNGNPVNFVDPWGLCPSPDTNDAQTCYDLVQRLDGWGIKMIWNDQDNLAESVYSNWACSTDPKLARFFSQKGSPYGSRWTTEEMTSVYNAFLVFDAGYRNLLMETIRSIQFSGENRSYTPYWPLSGNKIIKIVKSTRDDGLFGEYYFNERLIEIKNPVWGEGGRIDTEYTHVTDRMQYRSWAVLHEFGHAFSRDRVEEIIALRNLNNTVGNYLETNLPDQVEEFASADDRLVTAYPNIKIDGKELVIELLTGTLWNYGYSAVKGYTSDAGGRTGQIGGINGAFINVQDLRLGEQERITSSTARPLSSGRNAVDWVLTRILIGY